MLRGLPWRSDVADFVLNSAVVERGYTNTSASSSMPARTCLLEQASWWQLLGRQCLLAARCAELGTRNPALQCKLSDALVLPILSCVGLKSGV